MVQLVASGVLPPDTALPQLVTAEQQRTSRSIKGCGSDERATVRSTALSQLASALSDALHI